MKRLSALFLTILFIISCITACGNPDAEEIDWINIRLGDVLPEPQSNLMEITSNDKDWLCVHIYDISENDYYEYVRLCEEEKGFTIEAKSIGDSFYAYNQQGYDLSLMYDDQDQVLRIDLDAPVELGEYIVPEYAVDAGLPVPTSELGHFSIKKDDRFVLTVGYTSREEYYAYVDSCIAAGFTVDADRKTTTYSAYNANGFKVSITCKEYGIYTIGFYCPEIEEATEPVDTNLDENEQTEGTISPSTNTPEGCPTEADIISCLLETPNVLEAAAVTADNDPEGNLNTEDGYYAAIYFSVDLVNQDEISGENLISKGTDAGGCIEAYRTVEDAQARNAYLAGYNLAMFFDPEYHTVVGNLVIRTSRKLDKENQSALEASILASLENGNVISMLPTNSVETEKDEPGTEKVDIIVTMSEDELKGLEYAEAERLLREMGFSDIRYETLDAGYRSDLHNKISSVDIKSWLFGNGEFEKGDTFDADAIVVLWYYEYEEVVVIPNLTEENCADLATLLELRDPCDPSVAAFASQYRGQTIEFDGCITAMQNHEDYKTRYDVLIGAGDFDSNSMRGPNFRLTDVSYYDMNVTGGDSVYVGLNIHIVAKVKEYNEWTSWFELEIISMEVR